MLTNFSMLPSTVVIVETVEQNGVDGIGQPIFKKEQDGVKVIIAPQSTTDENIPTEWLDEIIYEVHFPKGFVKNLKNSKIILGTDKLTIIGNPPAYLSSPLEYNRRALYRVVA